MANPLLAVVIPVYNAAHFLPEAVESIRWQGCDRWRSRHEWRLRR